MEVEAIKKKILDLDKKKKVRFITLFGSVAQNKQNKLSDIDIAVYYDGNKKERFYFRIKALGELPDKVDIQIFQDLPLAVKKEVLSGKVIYSKNFAFTFDAYMEVIKDYNYFEKYISRFYEGEKGEV